MSAHIHRALPPEEITSHEEAPDNGGLVAGDVGGGEQLGERLAEVVHLLVQAPDVAARILQHPRRRALHSR